MAFLELINQKFKSWARKRPAISECKLRLKKVVIDEIQLSKNTRYRECVRAGAAGARTRRSLGHQLLHPLILRLLVLCAPAVLRPRALQDAPAPADSNS